MCISACDGLWTIDNLYIKKHPGIIQGCFDQVDNGYRDVLEVTVLSLATFTVSSDN